jgi:hypothetical protein
MGGWEVFTFSPIKLQISGGRDAAPTVLDDRDRLNTSSCALQDRTSCPCLIVLLVLLEDVSLDGRGEGVVLLCVAHLGHPKLKLKNS